MAQGSITKTISFACSKCGYVLFASPSKAGNDVECPACGSSMAVPAESKAMATDKPVSKPCPRCEIPLKLVPSLHGKHVRCNACQAVIAVSTRPWALSVLDTSRGKQQIVTQPCPSCSKDLRLFPALDGKHVRCKECNAVLAVSADPWSLSVVEGGHQAATEETTLPVLQAAAEAEKAETAAKEPADESLKAGETGAGWSFLGRLLLLAGTFLAVAVVGALGAWSFLGGDVGPPLKYLPTDVQCVVLVDVPQVLAEKDEKLAIQKLPLLPAMDTAERFLGNAGIKLENVRSIAVGGGKLGTFGTIVVYELERPINRSKTMQRPAFRAHGGTRKSEDWVGGVFMVTLGQVGFAFPDKKTIVTGSARSLEKALRGQWWPSRSSAIDIAASTQSEAAAMIAAGAETAPLLPAYIEPPDPVGPKLLGTATEISFGTGLKVKRVAMLAPGSSVEVFVGRLESALEKAAADDALPEEVRGLLERIKLEPGTESVTITWTPVAGDELFSEPVQQAADLAFGITDGS